MKTLRQTALLFFVVLVLVTPTRAQTMQLGEILILNTPTLNSDADTEAYEALLLDEVAPPWKAHVPGTELHLFRADRGGRTGDYLVVWSIDTREHRNASLPEDQASGFSRAVLERTGWVPAATSTFLSDTGSYTDYVLIGADRIGDLPRVDILGMHYIKVQADKEEAFERFVRDTLHPAFTDQTPGMRLLYYKGIRGEDAGSYITIFALESVEARAQYWPTDAPETEALKTAFKPMEPLAAELSTYLVEDSYLKAGSGFAAAIFESLEWTDFVHVRASATAR
jgi:hypothetical protein